MNDTTYRVVVTREGDAWLADVPELVGAHTFARSLSGLDQAVREVVVMAADLPDEAMPGLQFDYAFDTGDSVVDGFAAKVRQLRARSDHLAAEAARLTAEAVEQLIAHGLGVRDTAAVLGISPQRVSQLTAH